MGWCGRRTVALRLGAERGRGAARIGFTAAGSAASAGLDSEAG